MTDNFCNVCGATVHDEDAFEAQHGCCETCNEGRISPKERKAAEAIDAANDAMLANAYNNWPHCPRATVAFAAKDVPRIKDLLRDAGITVIPIDTVGIGDLTAAMHHYANTTDWSAFTRDQWKTALATLSEASP